MTRSAMAAIGMILLSAAALARQAATQTVDPATRFVQVANTYSLAADITYLRAGGADLKLDVYRPSNATDPTPVLMFMHGGGWTNGSKNSSLFAFLPFLEMGWAVVNVEYRLADVALAPAAVEDCRCALRWIYQNAKQYKFDLDNIVTTGQSAGGHLALTTGMIPESAGLDRQCPGDRRRAWTTGDLGTQEMTVAAVLDFYGITDVEDLMNRKPGTVRQLHRGLARQRDGPRRAREARLADDLRAKGTATDHDHPRHRRFRRAVRPGDEAEEDARLRRQPQRVLPGRRRRSRRVDHGGHGQDLQSHPRLLRHVSHRRATPGRQAAKGIDLRAHSAPHVSHVSIAARGRSCGPQKVDSGWKS